MKNSPLFRSPSLFSSLILAMVGTAGILPAQLTKVDELNLSSGDSARGVDVEWPYAWVSTFNDGVQHQIDLSVPFTLIPVGSFNPAWGDQWAEPIVRNGTLACGHRFGGLNLWDISGTPTQLDSVPTNYHFDGLARLNYVGYDLLLYSENNAGNNQGGLILYDVGGGALQQIGQSLVGQNLRDGRFLTATNDGWVYQFDGGAGSSRPLDLDIYDITTPTSPVFVQQFGMGNAVGNYTGNSDLQLHPAQQYLYAACGYDGLRILNIINRANPVVVNTLGAPNAIVKELDWGEGTVYMVVSVRLPNGQWRFRVLDCSNPINPVPIGNWMGDQDFIIHDLKALALATGPVVLVAGASPAGDAVIQLWM